MLLVDENNVVLTDETDTYLGDEIDLLEVYWGPYLTGLLIVT